MDVLMGRFCDARLAGLSESELADYEALMEVPDHDLYAWLAGASPPPDQYDTPVFRKLSAFNASKGH